MAQITIFNEALNRCIADVKSMNILKNDEIEKIDIAMGVLKMNNKAIIRNFQMYFLKDELVKHVFKSDIDFFIEYEVENTKVSPDEIRLMRQLQDTVRALKMQSNQKDNISLVFNHIKRLCCIAYQEIGVDPTEKISKLIV